MRKPSRGKFASGGNIRPGPATLSSLAGVASEYNGGAHPIQHFDTHISRTNGQELQVADMLLVKRSPSPAMTIAICEALKTAKLQRIKSATVMDEPVVCIGANANAKTEDAKLALAPSNQTNKFGGVYAYYDPYAVGPYSEGTYVLTVQQEIFAEDLKPEFKALFGGEAPPPAPKPSAARGRIPSAAHRPRPPALPRTQAAANDRSAGRRT